MTDEIVCPSCNGRGSFTYIVNPDNGFLDTQIQNLREETERCDRCKGTGRAPKEKDNVT
jgi:hypothetical protein